MSRWPSALNLGEVQQSFRDLWSSVEPLLTGNQDLHGRKFLNASDAVLPREFLTLGQGDKRYLRESVEATVETGVGVVRIDTFALRGAANSWPDTLFEASDRNYVAWASDGVSWLYAYGIHSRTQAQLTTLAGTLGTADAGYLVWVTDFEHVLRWSGSAWTFGLGDFRGGYMQFFAVAPTGNGWVLVDGTATSYLNADGTTTAYTPYDVSTIMLPYFRR